MKSSDPYAEAYAQAARAAERCQYHTPTGTCEEIEPFDEAAMCKLRA
jgi:hypothetical protein